VRGGTDLSEVEHGQQGFVNAPLFFGVEVSDELPEPGGVDRSCLFDEHAGVGAVDFDLRTKRGRSGVGGGWCDEYDGSGEQRV